MNVTVAGVMTSHVVTVDPKTPFKKIAETLRNYHITAVPVIGDQGLVGIVSEADLLDRRGPDAAAVMSTPVITIRPEATVAEAARVMQRHRVKRLPVVDAAGELAGIVSRADLLKVFVRGDAAISREIVEDILQRTLWIDPDEVAVTVRDGVVTLVGELESRSLCRILVRLTDHVPGVIEVHDRLHHRLDDTHLGVEPPPGALHYSAPERAGE